MSSSGDGQSSSNDPTKENEQPQNVAPSRDSSKKRKSSDRQRSSKRSHHKSKRRADHKRRSIGSRKRYSSSSSSSSSSSTSSSSSDDYERRRKRKKHRSKCQRNDDERRSKKKIRDKDEKVSTSIIESTTQDSLVAIKTASTASLPDMEPVGKIVTTVDVNDKTNIDPTNHQHHQLEKSKRMIPMTREQYEAMQCQVREVYDEETGRYRLVRGDGEIIERIVSRTDHQRINQIATRGDGSSFSKQIRDKAFLREQHPSR